MRVLVAGSGAVGIATAQQLSSKQHIVALLSSSELGTPYPCEDIPTTVKRGLTEIKNSSLDANVALADAVFCCGSIRMLWRLLKGLQNPLNKPIFFLTSWGRSLHDLKMELKQIGPYIIPCYPAFACELIEGNLVQVGEYRLEVANDWLTADEVVEVHSVLTSLSISHQLMVMESRFCARFSLTQFAYQFLRQNKLHGNTDESVRQLVESTWQSLDARCSEHPDLRMSLPFLLSSLRMILNHETNQPGLSQIASVLLNHKTYKMDYFLECETC